MNLLTGRKLLLADDSITIQKVVQLTFADEGMEVIAVSDGTEAINQLEKVVPDIVLADLFMPEPNGYKICELIKQDERFKHIPVIILVGMFEPYNAEEARRAGADDVLTKPFESIRQLVNKVTSLLGGKKSEEKIEDSSHKQLFSEETRYSSNSVFGQPLSPDPRPPQSTILPTQTPVADLSADDDLIEATPGERFTEERHATTSSAVPNVDIDKAFDLPDVSTVPIPEVIQSAIAEAPLPVEERASESTVEQAEQKSIPSRIVEETDGPLELDPVEVLYTSAEDFVLELEDIPTIKSSPVFSGKPKRFNRAKLSGGDKISDDAIDVIVQRVVEQISERVVQDVAWEVVPQLAELMIKRELDQWKQRAQQ
jgi:CheY-like chemotaxis protein